MGVEQQPQRALPSKAARTSPGNGSSKSLATTTYQGNFLGADYVITDGSGDIFMTRVHLLEPADFDGDGSSFDLDFQMELYYERDGELGHLYTMWRRMVLGPVDNSSELFISQTLSGFVDFENRVDAACVEGLLDE